MQIQMMSKLYEKQFKGKTYKDAYKKAMKFYSKIVGNMQVEISKNIYIQITKITDADFPTCKVELFVTIDCEKLQKQMCAACREFHCSFYINQQFNCDKCNMTAFIKHNKENMKRKQEYIMKQLNEIVG